MAAIDKDRALALIKELQEVQQREIEILKELHGIRTQPAHSTDVSDKMEILGLEGLRRMATVAPPAALINNMPPCWMRPWTGSLLKERVRQLVGHRESGMPSEAARVEGPETDFIRAQLKHLPSLDNMDFDFDFNSYNIKVLDFDHKGAFIKQDPIGPRSAESSFRRHIAVRDFTPSAIAILLLSEFDRFNTCYPAMTRHLSPHPRDRFYCGDRPWFGGSRPRELGMCGSITISFFSLSSVLWLESSPLLVGGKFGPDSSSSTTDVRENKYTLAWMRMPERGPSLVVAFGGTQINALEGYAVSLVAILSQELGMIATSWNEVLDELEKQTLFPSSLLFNEDERQRVIFDDANFTNAKKYFWALQTLRLFEDYVASTQRNIRPAFETMLRFEVEIPRDHPSVVKVLETSASSFARLRTRIERKRAEIESLNNGLFSASSVAEARFSSQQNSNIRLLTLVTIAFLPLSLAASIYGIKALPDGADLPSFFVVTFVMCAVTFAIVLNLDALTTFCRRRLLGIALASMAADQSSVWQARARSLKQRDQNKPQDVPASKWLYVGYLGHVLTSLFRRSRSATRSKQKTSESSDAAQGGPEEAAGQV